MTDPFKMAAPIGRMLRRGCSSVYVSLLRLPVLKNNLKNLSTTSRLTSDSINKTPEVFDEKLLEHLCCPLSKKDLRYDKEKNELVCDEIGVAYPIVNGIPNMIPEDARMIKNNQSLKTDSKKPS